jgi:hypothetical protein
MDHYRVGTSCEEADAYPPILLFKCLLLQKWFHIDLDPKLESQNNDRIPFHKQGQLLVPTGGIQYSKRLKNHAGCQRIGK